MNSPTCAAIWHGFAQARGGVLKSFAMGVVARHCFLAEAWSPSHDLRSLRCYPSPSLRSGPSQAGPFLVRRARCFFAWLGKNCFETCDIAVESLAITTNQRGSLPCAYRLSLSLFFPPRLPDACRTPPRGGLRVLRRVSSSLMRRTATCLQGPSSVALRVSQPAASRSACRPATRATERPIEWAACGRFDVTSRTIRASRPGGPFLCA